MTGPQTLTNEENSSAAHAGTRTQNLSITCPSLYHSAIPAPHHVFSLTVNVVNKLMPSLPLSTVSQAGGRRGRMEVWMPLHSSDPLGWKSGCRYTLQILWDGSLDLWDGSLDAATLFRSFGMEVWMPLNSSDPLGWKSGCRYTLQILWDGSLDAATLFRSFETRQTSSVVCDGTRVRRSCQGNVVIGRNIIQRHHSGDVRR